MLVLSPFSRGGHAASQVFDHTSQLRFIEERFGVRAPNVSKWRRANAGDLTSTLHLGRRDLTLPTLPSTADDQMANMLALGCTTGDIYEISNDQPAYPIPHKQVMPGQDASPGLITNGPLWRRRWPGSAPRPPPRLDAAGN